MACPPPSRPVITVSPTHEASEAATAASAALPPSSRISSPAATVAGCPAAIAAVIGRSRGRREWGGGKPARSKWEAPPALWRRGLGGETGFPSRERVGGWRPSLCLQQSQIHAQESRPREVEPLAAPLSVDDLELAFADRSGSHGG